MVTQNFDTLLRGWKGKGKRKKRKKKKKEIDQGLASKKEERTLWVKKKKKLFTIIS